MSADMISRVWDESEARGTDLLVLLAIADESGEGDWAWPRTATLAQRARVTMSSLQRILRRLVADGLVEIDEDAAAGTPDQPLYRVVLPPRRTDNAATGRAA